MSVGVKVKSSVSHGLSLQMALLHLKWQQIRQMELESPHEELSLINTPSFPLTQSHEEICTVA